MKSGFVGIIGRPNVGKSTLLNAIIGQKVAIISDKPQTTRNIIQGIYNDDEAQIIFVDTPGIHKPKNKLGYYLNKQTYVSMTDVDIVLFMVDASEKLGRGDLFVINRLKDIKKPVILVLNKIDKISKEQLWLKISEYKDLYPFSEIVPTSALKVDNVDRLINIIKGYLQDNLKYFDGSNKVTTSSKNFLVSEIIREKVLNYTNQEVPHAITCLVEHMEEKKDIIGISALIIVDRENLKKIIIGKGGSKLKEIGCEARLELETLFNKKVFLSLYVKTIKNWRDKEKYLSEFGFHKF